jgi:signal transduction histidine kinase
MKAWSLKVKVGVYAALLTMAALFAGVSAVMVVLYFYQISEIDADLKGDAKELVWDIKNFREAPTSPRELLGEKFIPVDMREYYLIIEGPEGQILYRSPNLMGSDLGTAVDKSWSMKILGKDSRVCAWRVDPYLVRVGARLNVIERFQKQLLVGFCVGLPVVGLVVFFGGVWLGRRAVAPVAQLSRAAERISASHPEERLPLPAAQDEIAKLTEVLNRSFDRLQLSYDVACRFSADASHQLKTPVTILRAGLDHLSQAPELNEAQLKEVSLLRQQTRRLASLIDDLLLLAQADAGRVFLESGALDLKTLIQSATDDLQVLVEGKGIKVEENLPESLPVIADRRLVAMVLQNLVENAAKYTPHGGVIRITGIQENDWVTVRVSNTAQEISQEDRGLIFDRFRRGKMSGGWVSGHGLGLNIARELIRVHGGELHLLDPRPGWVEFEFKLPVNGVEKTR